MTLHLLGFTLKYLDYELALDHNPTSIFISTRISHHQTALESHEAACDLAAILHTSYMVWIHPIVSQRMQKEGGQLQPQVLDSEVLGQLTHLGEFLTSSLGTWLFLPVKWQLLRPRVPALACRHSCFAMLWLRSSGLCTQSTRTQHKRI